MPRFRRSCISMLKAAMDMGSAALRCRLQHGPRALKPGCTPSRCCRVLPTDNGRRYQNISDRHPSASRCIFLIPRRIGVHRMARNDLQGSLDLLVLKTLSQVGSLHGYGIVLHIEKASDALLNVEEGSLYPALHRMEQSGWVRSEWALTETGRKAKYYKLTPAGRKQLGEAEESWEQVVKGVQAILRFA